MRQSIAAFLFAVLILVGSEAGAQVASAPVQVPTVSPKPRSADPVNPSIAPRPASRVTVATYNDFPYHGGFYGRAYEPWTWPNLARGYGWRGQVRYYDPPLK